MNARKKRSKFNKAVYEECLKMEGDGKSVADICKWAGIDRSTFERWKGKYPNDVRDLILQEVAKQRKKIPQLEQRVAELEAIIEPLKHLRTLQKFDREEKESIINFFCQVYHLPRRYAFRLLNIRPNVFSYEKVNSSDAPLMSRLYELSYEHPEFRCSDIIRLVKHEGFAQSTYKIRRLYNKLGLHRISDPLLQQSELSN